METKERQVKTQSDFILYIKAGCDLTWAICRVVTQYKLWNALDLTVFEASLLENYLRLPDRTRTIYM